MRKILRMFLLGLDIGDADRSLRDSPQIYLPQQYGRLRRRFPWLSSLLFERPAKFITVYHAGQRPSNEWTLPGSCCDDVWVSYRRQGKLVLEQIPGIPGLDLTTESKVRQHMMKAPNVHVNGYVLRQDDAWRIIHPKPWYRRRSSLSHFPGMA